jgi:hypothetical protein
MATFIATYDLRQTNPDPHSKFLEKSRVFGWNYWILSDNSIWYRLPNTTLVGTFETMAAAEQALQATRTATQTDLGVAVTMEKWIIAQYTPARFNSDTTQQN